jgi:ABC-type uncharacterized transport system ATPase subunit
VIKTGAETISTIILEEVTEATPVVLNSRAMAASDGRSLTVDLDLAILGVDGQAIPTLTPADFQMVNSDCAFVPCGRDADSLRLPMGGYIARADDTAFRWNVSSDRPAAPMAVGLLLDQSIEDNIAFSAIQVKGEYLMHLGPFTQKSTRAIRKTAQRMIKELDIRCTSPAQHAGTFSGGNQQKVCIARALTLKPKFLFVSEPTRGIDIGAKKIVLETLRRLNREQGISIVMISSELEELRSICDRIAIVSKGEVVEILPPDADAAAFGLAMSGIKPEKGGEAHG